MSNTVYNSMVVTGKTGLVAKFKFDMSAPRPYEVKQGYVSRIPTDELKLEMVSKIFTFWNVLRPPVERYERYFSVSGWVGGKQYGEDDEYNWHNWNMANWNTKWDAHEIQVVGGDELPDGKAYWHIDFRTANTPPTNVFKMLGIAYPELTFEVKSIEEEGWGEEAIYTGGRMLHFREWDIPKTHGEAEKVWSECPCVEKKWSYSDCEVQVG